MPPEERVPSMAKGDELGRVGGADMIVKDAGRSQGFRFNVKLVLNQII